MSNGTIEQKLDRCRKQLTAQNKANMKYKAIIEAQAEAIRQLERTCGEKDKIIAELREKAVHHAG